MRLEDFVLRDGHEIPGKDQDIRELSGFDGTVSRLQPDWRAWPLSKGGLNWKSSAWRQKAGGEPGPASRTGVVNQAKGLPATIAVCACGMRRVWRAKRAG
jgi:hypothetical protein